MSRRKRSLESWESHIDRQIREAAERGEFEDLKGLGKPIPDLHRPYDELWWLRNLLKREDLEYLPAGLTLKRDLEAGLAKIGRTRTEFAVRRIVTELNDRIRHLNATQTSGPGSDVGLIDETEIVAQWRAARSGGP